MLHRLHVMLAFVVGLLVVAACGDIPTDEVSVIPRDESTTTRPMSTTTSPTTWSPAQVAYLDALDEAARWERLAEYGRELAEIKKRAAATCEGGGQSGGKCGSGRRLVTPAATPGAPSGNCAIPAYICKRESGFNPTAVSPGGSWMGKYQFSQSTWNHAAAGAGYGQYVGVPPHTVPEDVQDAVAAWLWNGGAGCGHWSAC